MNQFMPVTNLAALCVSEVTIVCQCACLFVQIFYSFLKHGNCYSYLSAASSSCKLSFHVLTKKFIDGKPLKSWQEKIQR